MRTMTVNLKPSVVARLIIRNQIDLNETWNITDAMNVLHEISRIEVDELLQIIDSTPIQSCLTPDEIPQFGKIETVWEVPRVLVETGMGQLNYAQVGFYLKNNESSTREANYKFGENHGKCAGMLGLVNYHSDSIFLSSISCAVKSIASQEEKIMLLSKLCFRIKSIALILKNARNGIVNGFDHLSLLSESTKIRRGASLKSIFKLLEKLENDDLSNRLKNITWNIN